MRNVQPIERPELVKPVATDEEPKPAKVKPAAPPPPPPPAEELPQLPETD